MCKKCKCVKCSDCTDERPTKKCCMGKVVCIVFVSFLFGCLIGVHKNVIKACIKGEDLPEAPVWHFWCR